MEQTPSIEFLFTRRGQNLNKIINLICERKVQPDGCRVEFGSGNVKNNEGSGSTKLAKEDTQGVDSTLSRTPLKMLELGEKYLLPLWKPSEERQQQYKKHQAELGRQPLIFKLNANCRFQNDFEFTISGFLPQISMRRMRTREEGSSIKVMAMKLVESYIAIIFAGKLPTSHRCSPSGGSCQH